MNPADIQTIIETGLPGSSATVTGEGGKYEAIVTSDDFEGLSTVKRHQLVYKLVNEHIASGAIHALSIKPLTAAESE